MKQYKLVIFLFILTLFYGCVKKNGRQNENTRVVFATGGCNGVCPIQVIDNLTVRYLGVKYCDRTGFFIGNISSKFWDTLNLKFEKIKFKQLDSSYQHSYDDLSTEIYIYYDDKVKHLKGQSERLPYSLMSVYSWLPTEIKQIKLKPIKESLKFPTRIENQ